MTPKQDDPKPENQGKLSGGTGAEKKTQPAEGQKPPRPADTKYTFKILPANPRSNSTDFEDVADK